MLRKDVVISRGVRRYLAAWGKKTSNKKLILLLTIVSLRKLCLLNTRVEAKQRVFC